MNIVLWIVAGGVLGWAAYSYLNLNADRGLRMSLIIGAAGGFLGGNVIAPMLLAPAGVPAEFSSPALIIAAAAAAACLFAGNLIQNRWGV